MKNIDEIERFLDSFRVCDEMAYPHVNFGDENKKYGLPMSGDLLRLENFFWPATRIIADGRGANAHFLQNNFTRNWEYEYHKEVDQHHFYLNENPWGDISEKFVNFKEGRLKIE